MKIPSSTYAVCCGLLLLCFVSEVLAEVEFPELTGRVVDNAELLSEPLEEALTEQLRTYEEKTTNQVVVVTVQSLQGVSIERFGKDLGNHWGIGQKDMDNGVLLIVAPNERKVHIEVGLGLEAKLTNSTAQIIIDQKTLPQFRGNIYPEGVRSGTKAIIAALEGTYIPGESAKKKPERKSDGGSSFFWFSNDALYPTLETFRTRWQ